MKNSENKKVLFLSLSGIGNLIMQLPAIKAVKDAHPDWHITVWVAPRGTKSIAQAQSYINEVIEMPIKASMFKHAKNILALQKHRFDIGIVLSPGQLLKSALYLFLSGIPVRIGHAYPFRGRQHADNFLTQALIEKPQMHDIEQNLELVEPLLNEPIKFETYDFQIPEYSMEEAQYVLQSLVHSAVSSPIFIGFHPGSAQGFTWKRWPLERFAEVARAVHKKNPNTIFLIFGSNDEEQQKRELANMINEYAPSTAFHISAPILTTAAIMKRCTLFISNDSGLMHIASAIDIPTIGLFGPTDERQTGPRGSRSISLRSQGTQPVYNTESAPSFGNTAHSSILEISSSFVLDNIPSNVL